MTYNEVLGLIERATREGWRVLSLRGKKLTVLPPEIGQLNKLQILYINNNFLTSLPPEIGKLKKLQELYASNNQLTVLPPEIGQLTNLQRLHIRVNKLTTLPEEISNLTSLQWLYLDYNELEFLPAELGLLTSLQQLFLKGNHLSSIPPEIKRMSRLLLLDLRKNRLKFLPSEIGQLNQLQKLLLKGNQLTTLPKEIGQLIRLQTLDLRENQLKTITPEIGKLTNLKKLDLIGNKLTSIPNEIGLLSDLQWLYLSQNQLTYLPPEIGKLYSLQEFDISGNRLRVVPPEIGFLPNLQRFALSRNQLMIVPPEFSKLKQLQQLGLMGNQLSYLPLEISQLTCLLFLDLSHNQFSSIPPEITKLTGLQTLIFNRNELTTIPSNIDRLTNLQSLDLSRNNLATLSLSLMSLGRLEKLHLYDNPLPLPPEILGARRNPGNPKEIFNTYFQASRPLNEAKLLLVGEGSVGKTSLVERLLWDRHPSKSGKTVGVDIHRWEVGIGNWGLETEETPDRLTPTTISSQSYNNHLRVNVWDFGGQEIYHATHQFFLTHRSLYLVVLEARKDEAANRLDYWLRHVQSFAGDAPIILVVNKSDQGRLALDERGLMLKHPAIQAIVHTSCTTGAGIADLRQAVETALASLPHINDWIPLTWFEVKEKLAALEQDTLPYDSYVQLCLDAGIEHEAAQRTLARFLHDLGAALNFQDDRRLASTHVLNPEWVTGGIYRILNADKWVKNGVLRLDDLDAILDRRRYPPEKQPFLLDIMHKFELSVPLDRDRYLIPGLLPKERPAFAWPSGSTAALEYRYAILPAAILSRLMVRLHAHIWQAAPGQPVRWRNGLVIHGDGCRALIAADPAANRLSISLDGPAPQRRHLLAVVRAQLAEIHASFAQLEAEAWVPLPDQLGKAVRYRALLNLESRGIASHYDPDNDVELDVYALLDGIEAPDERAARPLRQLMVERFNMDELRTLCFELGLDIETWPNEGKPALVRNLVLHFLKQGRLSVLEEKVRGERPYG